MLGLTNILRFGMMKNNFEFPANVSGERLVSAGRGAEDNQLGVRT